MRIALSLLLVGAVSLTALAEPSPESLHYDSEQQALDYMLLSYACGKGHPLTIGGLLRRGAPVNRPPPGATDIEGLAQTFEPPLLAAARIGNERVVEVLLNYGADPDIRWHRGFTALHLAARKGHRAVVSVLLKGGANPSLASAEGLPLDLARASGHAEIVALLEAY